MRCAGGLDDEQACTYCGGLGASRVKVLLLAQVRKEGVDGESLVHEPAHDARRVQTATGARADHTGTTPTWSEHGVRLDTSTASPPPQSDGHTTQPAHLYSSTTLLSPSWEVDMQRTVGAAAEAREL